MRPEKKQIEISARIPNTAPTMVPYLGCLEDDVGMSFAEWGGLEFVRDTLVEGG
jgi:hypothetical protein